MLFLKRRFALPTSTTISSAQYSSIIQLYYHRSCLLPAHHAIARCNPDVYNLCRPRKPRTASGLRGIARFQYRCPPGTELEYAPTSTESREAPYAHLEQRYSQGTMPIILCIS
eukprot:3196720-Rhodomonas_salina.1